MARARLVHDHGHSRSHESSHTHRHREPTPMTIFLKSDNGFSDRSLAISNPPAGTASAVFSLTPDPRNKIYNNEQPLFGVADKGYQAEESILLCEQQTLSDAEEADFSQPPSLVSSQSSRASGTLRTSRASDVPGKELLDEDGHRIVPEPSSPSAPQAHHECPFLFTGCVAKFSDWYDCYEHSKSHFYCRSRGLVTPPRKLQCPFCPSKVDHSRVFADDADEWSTWLSHMHHVAGHQQDSLKLRSSRPDVQFISWLRSKKLITDRSYLDLVGNAGRQIRNPATIEQASMPAVSVVSTRRERRHRGREQAVGP